MAMLVFLPRITHSFMQLGISPTDLDIKLVLRLLGLGMLSMICSAASMMLLDHGA